MALDTYDDLKQSVEDWLDRDDLTTRIPDFIQLAEEELENLLRTRAMIKRSTATVDDRFLALPDDYLDMNRLQLNTSPVTKLTQVSPSVLSERFRVQGNGKPLFYCVHEEIEFNREPDKNYTAELVYFSKLQKLSDTVSSNDTLDQHPGIYLAGALKYAMEYLHDDEGEAKWSAKFLGRIEDANETFRRGQYSKGPLTTTVDSPTP